MEISLTSDGKYLKSPDADGRHIKVREIQGAKLTTYSLT